ncbi:MAG: alpha/beta hydrolase [Deltaproteobacteria bacterium]|nr:alpha/beta hydrolase [Deltaproteobacteria bacterium]
MYRTQTRLRRPVHVHFPSGDGRVLLRTELDWDKDVEPVSVSPDGTRHEFLLESDRPFLYVKPCLRRGAETVWATGPNMLVLLTTDDARLSYPFFDAETSTGTMTPVIEVPGPDRTYKLRAYLPPGYGKNPFKRFPVLYMQDGKNIFFPDEAFGNREWQVDESLDLLDDMNAADKCIVVGLHSEDRMRDYTRPGYEAYGRAVVDSIKPFIDRTYRTLPGRGETGLIGSSLGGVASFFLGWQFPETFGFAACLSSTFSHKDDLMDRVLAEPRRETRFYLDSGWPGDNYEVTLAMSMALIERGYVLGRDVVHFAFPLAEHDEGAWGKRLHLPLQLFCGPIATAARGRFV